MSSYWCGLTSLQNPNPPTKCKNCVLTIYAINHCVKWRSFQVSSGRLVLSHLGLAFVLMLRPFFPELVMSTDLLSFEHPSVLLFCFVNNPSNVDQGPIANSSEEALQMQHTNISMVIEISIEQKKDI